MTEQNNYLALERLSLGDSNWLALLNEMQSKGANSDSNAFNINHWRPEIEDYLVRDIYIFQALFDSANVDIDKFKDWLSVEFGIPAEDIGEQTGYNQYGRFSTFSYPDGVKDRFRLGVFGFVQGQGYPTWEESHDAVLQYLSDNLEDWEEEIGL